MREPVRIWHFNSLGFAEIICESPSFAATFAKKVEDINGTSDHATKTSSLLVAVPWRSNLPYAGFLFLSAAQAPDELWTKISIEFCKDGADAVFKALDE